MLVLLFCPLSFLYLPSNASNAECNGPSQFLLSLPEQHIISNAEYYGPSLFLLATDVVNGYIFQEPSLLSSLQDSGLTDVVLHALLVKDVRT